MMRANLNQRIMPKLDITIHATVIAAIMIVNLIRID